MQRRRFYAPPDSIIGATVMLSREETHHLTRVLRLKPGDEAFVFDGCGREYRCSLVKVEANQARLEVIAELLDAVESPLRLILGQSLTKGEKFDFIVQKATELGVSSIVPLLLKLTLKLVPADVVAECRAAVNAKEGHSGASAAGGGT